MDTHTGFFIKLGDKNSDYNYDLDKVEIISITAQQNDPAAPGEDPAFTFAINVKIANVKRLDVPTDVQTIHNTCAKGGFTFWPLNNDGTAILNPTALQMNVIGDPNKSQAGVVASFTIDPGKVNNSAGLMLTEADPYLSIF